MKDDQGDLDLTLLIENHQKQIWDFKKRESQWIMDKNQLEGNQKIISELSAKLVDVTRSNVELKNKLTDAEGETSLVKAIGINSPEMKALQQINEDHKKINGDLQKALTTLEQENIEIHTDNIKLSRQIEDLLRRKDKDKY